MADSSFTQVQIGTQTFPKDAIPESSFDAQNSLRPVTILQLLQAKKISSFGAGARLQINNVPIPRASFIANVLSISYKEGLHIYELTDGTGVISARHWSPPTTSKHLHAPDGAKKMLYVRVVGRPAPSQDQNVVTIDRIWPIENPHELYWHLLDAMVATRSTTRLPPTSQQLAEAFRASQASRPPSTPATQAASRPGPSQEIPRSASQPGSSREIPREVPIQDSTQWVGRLSASTDNESSDGDTEFMTPAGSPQKARARELAPSPGGDLVISSPPPPDSPISPPRSRLARRSRTPSPSPSPPPEADLTMRPDPLSHLSSLQREIMAYLLDARHARPDDVDGVYMTVIVRGLPSRLSVGNNPEERTKLIGDAFSSLEHQGYIYSTKDEMHYAIADF